MKKPPEGGFKLLAEEADNLLVSKEISYLPLEIYVYWVIWQLASNKISSNFMQS